VLSAAPTSVQPSLFTSAHASTANYLDAANQDVSNGHSTGVENVRRENAGADKSKRKLKQKCETK